MLGNVRSVSCEVFTLYLFILSNIISQLASFAAVLDSVSPFPVRRWLFRTTTTVSFICMTITIQYCKSAESMIIQKFSYLGTI